MRHHFKSSVPAWPWYLPSPTSCFYWASKLLRGTFWARFKSLKSSKRSASRNTVFLGPWSHSSLFLSHNPPSHLGSLNGIGNASLPTHSWSQDKITPFPGPSWSTATKRCMPIRRRTVFWHCVFRSARRCQRLVVPRSWEAWVQVEHHRASELPSCTPLSSSMTMPHKNVAWDVVQRNSGSCQGGMAMYGADPRLVFSRQGTLQSLVPTSFSGSGCNWPRPSFAGFPAYGDRRSRG